MNTLDFITTKFNLTYDEHTRMPVEIRDFDRAGLAALFGELGFKYGVEVGVRDGIYSEVLMKAIPGLVLGGVDPYEPHRGYRDHTRKSSFGA